MAQGNAKGKQQPGWFVSKCRVPTASSWNVKITGTPSPCAKPTSQWTPPPPPSEQRSLPTAVALWAGGVLLGVLATWTLANTESIVSSIRTALPPVLAIPMPSAAIMALAATTVGRLDGVLDWIAPVLTTGLSSLIAPILAASIAYAIRVRAPAGPEPEPT